MAKTSSESNLKTGSTATIEGAINAERTSECDKPKECQIHGQLPGINLCHAGYNCPDSASSK
ncbi:hypothetical protein DOY81_009516 [Sarcophaga bullata]|nr:hypothetical protein DOY81_009516 [Sarcophaga bullata]